MANVEIEQQITELEDQYSNALKTNADVHSLSVIWRRIKELKHELVERGNKS